MTFLAAGLASSPGSSSSTISDVEPGLLGFIVVAALAVALVFLLRSMNKQFRKIGPRPEEPEPVGADEISAARINAAAGIEGPPAADAAESDGAVTVGLAGLTEPDTGDGFAPDTGARKSRGSRS